MTIKFCMKCGRETEHNPRGRCKACIRAYGIAHRLAHPGENAAKCREHYAKNKSWWQEYRKLNAEEMQRKYKEWAAKNLKYLSEYAKAWRKNNPERTKATQSRHYQQNSSRIRAENAEYKKRNKDRVDKWRAEWFAANPEKRRQYAQSWFDRNPGKKRVYRIARRSREAGAQGHFSPEDIFRLMDEQKGRCVYCGKSIEDEYHIDHTHPLSKGGSNWPSNLQLLCPKCNLRKSASSHEEYQRKFDTALI